MRLCRAPCDGHAGMVSLFLRMEPAAVQPCRVALRSLWDGKKRKAERTDRAALPQGHIAVDPQCNVERLGSCISFAFDAVRLPMPSSWAWGARPSRLPVPSRCVPAVRVRPRRRPCPFFFSGSRSAIFLLWVVRPGVRSARWRLSRHFPAFAGRWHGRAGTCARRCRDP